MSEQNETIMSIVGLIACALAWLFFQNESNKMATLKEWKQKMEREHGEALQLIDAKEKALEAMKGNEEELKKMKTEKIINDLPWMKKSVKEEPKRNTYWPEATVSVFNMAVAVASDTNHANKKFQSRKCMDSRIEELEKKLAAKTEVEKSQCLKLVKSTAQVTQLTAELEQTKSELSQCKRALACRTQNALEQEAQFQWLEKERQRALAHQQQEFHRQLQEAVKQAQSELQQTCEQAHQQLQEGHLKLWEEYQKLQRVIVEKDNARNADRAKFEENIRRYEKQAKEHCAGIEKKLARELDVVKTENRILSRRTDNYQQKVADLVPRSVQLTRQNAELTKKIEELSQQNEQLSKAGAMADAKKQAMAMELEAAGQQLQQAQASKRGRDDDEDDAGRSSSNQQSSSKKALTSTKAKKKAASKQENMETKATPEAETQIAQELKELRVWKRAADQKVRELEATNKDLQSKASETEHMKEQKDIYKQKYEAAFERQRAAERKVTELALQLKSSL